MSAKFPRGGGGGGAGPFLARSLHGLVVAPKFLYDGILQRNYRKMTIQWSFSYNMFLKLSLYNMIHL